MTTKQDKHYFAVDAFGWATDEDLDKAVKRRIDDTGSLKYVCVFEVPGPSDSHYKIEFYQPQVEGSKMIRELHGTGKSKRITKEIHHHYH